MAGKRKVGVLTFHKCINYGSYWQARCLVEGLRGRGYDVTWSRGRLGHLFDKVLPRPEG